MLDREVEPGSKGLSSVPLSQSEFSRAGLRLQVGSLVSVVPAKMSGYL